MARPEITVGRGTVYTNRGMVCSISPLAASAGIGVLRDGGNAFDAAIATAAAECVTVPHSCGFGGETFALMYHAGTGRTYGISGSGKAPLAANRDLFIAGGHKFLPSEGPLAPSIPGEVDAYASILERFGTRSLDSLLQPAIRYAEEGFPLSPRLARGFGDALDKLNRYTDTARVFTRNGEAYRAGDILVQKNLAETLGRIARDGAEEFYQGETAREIVRSLQDAGGLFTLDEFARHETEWYEPPIATEYRGYTVYETAPPSQGFMLLEMLNILEGFDLAGMEFYSAEAVHAMVEAKKLAFADRNAYMGDPKFVSAPVDELISKDFADRRRRLISPDRVLSSVEAGPVAAPVPGDGDTSYLCVVDGEGNAVSFIHSLFHGFGSGFVAGTTGIVLNDRTGSGLSLVEGHPNVVEPGKRTMHTLNAYMVFQGKKPYLIGGTPGGDRQVQWNAQVIANVLDYGMDPQEAVEAPRWVSMPGTDPRDFDDPFTLETESGMAPEEAEKLRALGHQLSDAPPEGLGGSTKLIMVDGDSSVRTGGSDPRTDGHAAAL